MNGSNLLISCLFVFLIGCATAGSISRVQMGMTRDDVISTMGRPTSTSAKGDTEYLNYALSETGDDAFRGITTPYFVRLVNGKVDSFGRLGDFDSTQKPTVRIETDENIKTSNSSSSSSRDLYTELTKLKQLKDEGILTQEEFDKAKKRLLENR